jgi:predicted ATPase
VTAVAHALDTGQGRHVLRRRRDWIVTGPQDASMTRPPRPTHVEPPRIEKLRVTNYRALRQLDLERLTPLTVLLGPNGSGKSTVFDVFAFLSECFTSGLRKAWDKRGRFKELRSRGAEGPIEFELQYRERKKAPLITYQLAIGEGTSGPVVQKELLRWKRKSFGAPFRFLDFENGAGTVVSGDDPDEHDQRIDEKLDSPEFLAVSTLGQFAKHPRVSALRRFITSWYLAYLTADNTRTTPEAGPQERLSQTGDNLPNVIQHLKEQHPERLEQIRTILARRVPRLERFDADLMPDGRLLLRMKDAPFASPVRLGWHAEDAGLSDTASRPGTTTVGRHRGTGEPTTPALAAGVGGRSEQCIGAHAADDHHALPIPPGHPAAGTGACSLSRRPRLYAEQGGRRHAPGRGNARGRQPSRPALDGGVLRRW